MARTGTFFRPARPLYDSADLDAPKAEVGPLIRLKWKDAPLGPYLAFTGDTPDAVIRSKYREYFGKDPTITYWSPLIIMVPIEE
jgi:hypothetical protein